MTQQRRVSGFLIMATALVLLGCSNPTAPSWQRRTYVSSIPVVTTVILAFGFNTPVATGVITTATDRIAVSVPNGTDLTELVPTLVHTGMIVSPVSGQCCDFSSPVTYTVTGADGTFHAYTVTVTHTTTPPTAPVVPKSITAFTFPASAGTVIDEESCTIAVTMPFGSAVDALAPSITHTGASLSPASGQTCDFTVPLTYLLTGTDN